MRSFIKKNTCVCTFSGQVTYIACFALWRYLALFGVIWRYLALFGVIWRYLAL
jgi:hypothetical protein